MNGSIKIDISPATVCDRLRKLEQNMTDENRHDEAFLVNIAIEAIRTLMEREGEKK